MNQNSGLFVKSGPYWNHVTKWIKRDAKKEWVIGRDGAWQMVDHVMSLIDPPQSWRVLDAGCKEAWTGQYLDDRYGFRNCVSVEIDIDQVQYARSKGRYNGLCGDICAMPFIDQSFDLVFCRHVLGLTRDAWQAILEINRVTKIGGCYYIVTHVPGNVDKHYSYIPSIQVIDKWLDSKELFLNSRIFYDINPYQYDAQDKTRKEIVIFLRRTQ